MRNDRLKGFNADPQFLALQMDPAALAKMQPQEITNLLLTMSQQQVESLRRQKATLNNAAAVQSAALTAEQFDAMAPDFGLKQHLDPTASKTDKQRYSVTKEAVDEALQQAQTAAKAPLSQEARMKLARDAVANTVVLNPGWFSSNKPAQVGTVLPSEVGQVVVPDGDRGQIIAKARAEKNDPKYTPTAEEIGRAYLARRRQVKGQ